MKGNGQMQATVFFSFFLLGLCEFFIDLKRTIYIALFCAFVCSGLVLPFGANAQTIGDTFTVKQVEVNGEKQVLLTGLKTTFIDSATLSYNRTATLADVLMQSNSIFFKSFGVGLSTPVFRGTNASQSKVYWDGVPITSSTHSTFDYTLVPITMVDAIEVDYGNASLKNSTGSFGVGVNLITKNKPADEVLIFRQSIGSFGTYKSGLTLNFGNQKFWGSTNLYYEKAKNDYSFINTAKSGSPVEKETRAAFTQYGILQKFGCQISEKDVLTLTTWYHVAPRDITPPIISNSIESRKDSSLRFFLNHEHKFKKSVLSNKFYFGNERLKYINLTANLFEVNNAYRYNYVSALEGDLTPKINYNLNGYILHDNAVTNHYKGTPNQTRYSISGTGTHSINDNFRYSVVAREEVINSRVMPIIYNASVLAGWLKDYHFFVKASYGTNYNYPGINDLYWVPGGNPNLQAEYAKQAEIGLHFTQKIKVGSFTADVTGFNNRITNQIIWLPGKNGFYEAYNLKKVNVVGLEFHTEAKILLGDLSIIPKLKYSYTQSTNLEGINALDDSKNKQVVYVPYHLTAANIRINYKTIDVYGEYQYTGFRYITSDNTDFLPAYGLVNISAGNRFSIYKNSISLRLKINNLFNTNYQAVAWYPMPGRYIEISTQININK
ncbi:MAG: TonB-dependent receptor [Bacteroidetes bacterium]|nr:TonB-dependent receptor [Bacteroidota bacterium]